MGSWDNFAEPWEMVRDNRRGRGHWTGCHTFRNIVCDGDATGIHERRDGALKMGGTYWYYVSSPALGRAIYRALSALLTPFGSIASTTTMNTTTPTSRR